MPFKRGDKVRALWLNPIMAIEGEIGDGVKNYGSLVVRITKGEVPAWTANGRESRSVAIVAEKNVFHLSDVEGWNARLEEISNEFLRLKI